MSYTLTCEIVKETTDAILVADPRDKRQHWIPLSQVKKIVRDSVEILKPRTGTVVMTEWIARQKGLP